MIQKTGNLFATAYLLLIFCVYPFYMSNGYIEIGEAKYHFFISFSLAGLAILSITALAAGIKNLWHRYQMREAYLIRWDRIRPSATDLFVLLFAAETVFSYSLSDYRQEALQGTEGWRIGLVLLLTLCGLYFLLSRQWKGSSLVWFAAMAASGIVFFLGITDRFSIYLISIDIRDPAFISTLGNINWFCGYFSVLVPVGACIFLFSKDVGWRIFSAIYLLIAFMAGFCQGSSSVFLFFGALFFALLWAGVSDQKWISRWFFLAALWWSAAWVIGRLRSFLPEGYNYETDNLCAAVTSAGWLPAAGMICILAGFWFGRKKERHLKERQKEFPFRLILAIIPAAGIFLFGAVLFLNTRSGIPGLADHSFFLFRDDWGNGRGETWKAGIMTFAQMSSIQKLLGAGPDCFSAYAYSRPRIAGMLRDYFGSSRLTNAHNEFLTSLVNVGVIGTIFYFGIFLSSLARCLRRAVKNPWLLIPAVSVFCYLVHNIVSFAQVLNLPFVFLIMAMGEGIIRKAEEP